MKHKSFAILFIIILAITITFIGCGRKGSLNPNTPPYIEISRYSGIEKPDTLADSTFFEVIGEYIDPAIYDSLFYQVIYWRAYDEDGIVTNFAYRIGTWDSTANQWLYDQAYGITVDEDGWVQHVQPNGELSMWTPNKNKPYARVYFPSKDTTDFRRNFGKFEVICRDNRGEISNTAKKYFATHSEVPATSISTSQGVIDSCRVGTAIRFKFMPMDPDPYGLGDEAAYYKYRLVYVPRVGAREDTLGKGFSGYEFGIGTEILDSTDWYSTEGFENPDEVFLRGEYPYDDPYADRKPRLLANDINELTQIQVKTVDKAGIEDPNYAKMTFFVRDYFKPETRGFEMSTADEEKPCNILPRIFVLGENHYLTYLEQADDRPKKIVNGQEHYATQFYYNLDKELTTLWSNDLEIHLKWEYYGEYMVRKEPDGSFSRVYKGYTFHYDENLPIKFEPGEHLRLPEGYCKYYCEVEYMDIQLDSTVTDLPPLSGNIVSDEFGDWMRVPISQTQTCKLFGLLPGKHTFRARAVDFQDAVDPTPATLEFNLIQIEDTKNGVLVIDDSPHHNIFSPEEEVDLFYEELLSDLPEPITVYDIDDFGEISTLNSYDQGIGHQKGPALAPSDLVDYKLIIWHATNNPAVDYLSDKCHLPNHYNLLSLYLESGGNLLFTGGGNLRDRTAEVKRFLEEYAGFSNVHYTMNRSIPFNLMLSDFAFSQAEGLENYNDVNVNLHLRVGRYNPIDLTNPNFNDWEDNLPVGWEVTDGTIIDSSSEPSGELIISHSTGQGFAFQTIPLELEETTSCDSVKFELKYDSKQDTTAVTYKIEVYDLAQNQTLKEFVHDNTTSESFIQYFFVPTDCDSIELRLWTPEEVGKKAYWDNFSLKFGYWMPEYYGTTSYRKDGIGGITYFDLGEASPIYKAVHESPNAEGYVGSKYAKPFANGKVGTTYILGFPLFYIQMDDAKTFIQNVCDDIGILY
jgi:hypothetical protein